MDTNKNFSKEEIEEIKNKIFNTHEISIYPFRTFFLNFLNYCAQDLNNYVTIFIDLIENNKFSYDTIDTSTFKMLMTECDIDITDSEIQFEALYVEFLKNLTHGYILITRVPEDGSYGTAMSANRQIDMWPSNERE
ncbi:MAG: hypothetical protein QG566_767 [Patescibacteria group bacterium]|jgi:hypothetical protein|nr:hypothetical protein [Patescibacteria group bacterium]